MMEKKHPTSTSELHMCMHGQVNWPMCVHTDTYIFIHTKVQTWEHMHTHGANLYLQPLELQKRGNGGRGKEPFKSNGKILLNEHKVLCTCEVQETNPVRLWKAHGWELDLFCP